MAKKPTIEQQMADLVRLATAGKTPLVADAVKTAIASKQNLLAAKAAGLAEELNLNDLVGELSTAFDRFMMDPVRTDKGCVAKAAIAKALYALGIGEVELFLRGVRHVQFEAGWGKPSDVAGELRATSALALVRMGYRDVMWELGALLADKDPLCRQTAARAIAYSERDDGLPLLRHKVLSGDEDDVLAECFTALVRLSAAKGIPLVAEFLESPQETRREAAALALGASRRPEAFELLRDRWEQWIDLASRKVLMLAMATLRIEPAIEFLMTVIREDRPGPAMEAIKSLAIYRGDEGIRSKLSAALANREEDDVRQIFREKFG